jgi:hypothetical protein
MAGRRISNLRTVESKSARIHNDFKAFSNQTADSAPRQVAVRNDRREKMSLAKDAMRYNTYSARSQDDRNRECWNVIRLPM